MRKEFLILINKAGDLLGEKGEDHVAELLSRNLPKDERLTLAQAYIKGAIDGREAKRLNEERLKTLQPKLEKRNQRRIEALIHHISETRLK